MGYAVLLTLAGQALRTRDWMSWKPPTKQPGVVLHLALEPSCCKHCNGNYLKDVTKPRKVLERRLGPRAVEGKAGTWCVWLVRSLHKFHEKAGPGLFDVRMRGLSSSLA